MPNIEFIPLSLVDDYDKNSNTHPQAQIENIKALMLYVGWTVPALVRKTGERYGLIAGHGRREAANELQGKPLKMADGTPIPVGCIPVLFADGWSDEQIRAYVIADNQVPRQSIFDEFILSEELQALQDGGLDLGMIGFDDGELERLLASMEPEPEYQTDPDDAPEVDEESTPVSVRGMVWLCGNHRVMCGDSTITEDVRKLMAGQQVGLCFTSPPYGQQRDYEDAKELVKDWDNLMQGVFSNVAEKSDTQILVNLGLIHKGELWEYWRGWIEWMRQQGWKFYSQYIWDQGSGLPGNFSGRLAPSYEIIFHFNKTSREVSKTKDKKEENIGLSTSKGMRDEKGVVNPFSNSESSLSPVKIPDNVIRTFRQLARDEFTTQHPAVFPVNLCKEIILPFTTDREICYEPFCGSGTQVIACEETRRVCYGMELTPKYVDVIVKRWQQFTGKQATLENDGRTFNEIASLCP